MPEIPALGTTGKVGFRYMVNSRTFTQAIAYVIICLGQRRCVHQKGNHGKADGSLALSPHSHPPLSDSPRGPKGFTFITVCLSRVCEACVYVCVFVYLRGQACACRITRMTVRGQPCADNSFLHLYVRSGAGAQSSEQMLYPLNQPPYSFFFSCSYLKVSKSAQASGSTKSSPPGSLPSAKCQLPWVLVDERSPDRYSKEVGWEGSGPKHVTKRQLL